MSPGMVSIWMLGFWPKNTKNYTIDDACKIINVFYLSV